MSESDSPVQLGEIEPLADFDSLARTSIETKMQWKDQGLQAIANGEVCALVLSGGQGTRLGFSGPKGMYNIGLPSQKSLFQLFCERILRLQNLAQSFSKGQQKATIPFYIMTSPMNHDTTCVFFKQNDYFGLHESQVMFFPQGTLPCFTTDGKLMLESVGKLATASDGNGGIYSALSKSGALRKMEQEGAKYIHVFSVDNAMCKVADPTFIGYCITKNADCGNKVVWKSRANG